MMLDFEILVAWFINYVKNVFMTFQPALFENIVSETLQHLQEVVQARPGEKQVLMQATQYFSFLVTCTCILIMYIIMYISVT